VERRNLIVTSRLLHVTEALRLKGEMPVLFYKKQLLIFDFFLVWCLVIVVVVSCNL
jgi:hypothetical protein